MHYFVLQKEKELCYHIEIMVAGYGLSRDNFSSQPLILEEAEETNA
jgi:hypothetical protein